jgi:hypothetical protein
VGFFDWLRGRPATPAAPAVEVTVNLSTAPLTHAPRDRARDELLLRAARSPVTDEMRRTWDPLVGSLEGTVGGFVKDRLLVPASVADKLDYALRVADLRPHLVRRGLKVSGKKRELIDRLIGAIGEAEAGKLTSALRLYCPTMRGEEMITAIRARRDLEKAAVETSAAEELRAGNARRAGDAVAACEVSQVFARGLGIDWSEGMPPQIVEQAAYLVRRVYDDLPLPQRREIGIQLALAQLLGEPVRDAGQRLLAVTGGAFICESLSAFLLHPCGSYASGFEPDQPADLAEVYAHTRLFEATAAVNRERYRRDRVGKGIQILYTKNDGPCRICEHGRRQFRWSEIDRLVSLPRHWGCRCLYVAWID